MKYFVYILYAEKVDTYYIGQTNDVKARLDRHNSGREKATIRYKPWQLKWFTEKPTRSEAMELEKKLKNLTKERLRAFMQKYK